jgi:hypothetical protein
MGLWHLVGRNSVAANRPARGEGYVRFGTMPSAHGVRRRFDTRVE